ncbi:MAG: type II toxin-antitoxin system VapC family toxin [Actinomycetota bacterium]|uniref:type II toxin-antitoxin system VapC family toxin n=1 Tax=Candidatus Planktophila sp. TaxID=2175601 RepID=UPI002A06E146|nr:type II toxin-antitoxin system VapC family toxin [Actinomycetota bacterium]
MSWYLDSSAILKYVFAEPERPAMVKALTSQAISSELARLEVKRAVYRINPKDIALANDELSRVNFVSISNQVLTVAESFTGSVTLATLDAIHVATAISLGNQIEGIITYDKQMITNAGLMGIKVLSPGAKL